MLIGGFFRTNVSTANAVTPAMSIGHGCWNSVTDAKNGTNATELLTFANEMRRNVVSQRRASAAKATTPFHAVREDSDGRTHELATSNHAAARVTATTSAWIRYRSAKLSVVTRIPHST